MLELTPQELDAQSTIKVERWVDLNSQEMYEMDDMPYLTKHWLELGINNRYFFTDVQGRVWYKSPFDSSMPYEPYRFTYYGKEYGIRMSEKATS